MKKKNEDKPTVWSLFECVGGGARWSSAHHDYAGEVCTFSGCGCGSLVLLIDRTESCERTASWFRLPTLKTARKTSR